MDKEQMMVELVRIVNAALKDRAESARLGKNGITSPMSSYRCGQRDAFDEVIENIVQTFGIEIVDGKAVANKPAA